MICVTLQVVLPAIILLILLALSMRIVMDNTGRIGYTASGSSYTWCEHVILLYYSLLDESSSEYDRWQIAYRIFLKYLNF